LDLISISAAVLAAGLRQFVGAIESSVDIVGTARHCRNKRRYQDEKRRLGPWQ
jgi:hypothetical protein